MKIQFAPASGAKIVVVLKDGTELDNDDIKRVHLEPFISVAKGLGEVANGVCITHHGDVVDRFTLVASAKTGRISRKRAVAGPRRPI